jgi:hypothetical protein
MLRSTLGVRLDPMPVLQRPEALRLGSMVKWYRVPLIREIPKFDSWYCYCGLVKRHHAGLISLNSGSTPRSAPTYEQSTADVCSMEEWY